MNRAVAKRMPKVTSKPAAIALMRKISYVYRDARFGFRLKLPSRWRTHTVVHRSARLIDAEYGVFFLFKYKGKLFEDLFGLYVFRMTLKQWREQGYDESPFVFLTRRNGRIFAYLTLEELPHDFLNKSKDDYDYKKYGKEINLIRGMVNVDVPKIVKTFRFT
jgi:hypothetical protein